jgi:hypothetical protein
MASSSSFIDYFVGAAVVIGLVAWVRTAPSDVVPVRSTVDGREYLVRRLPDRQEAADVLARINADLEAVVRHMAAKYLLAVGQKEEESRQGREIAALLQRNYSPFAISEATPKAGFTSFAVDKGRKIFMCIRQEPPSSSLVDRNVLLYVALHELAHLGTSSVGHKSDFWDNFKIILKEAVGMGIYRPVDFAKTPQPYCGISITNSVI